MQARWYHSKQQSHPMLLSSLSGLEDIKHIQQPFSLITSIIDSTLFQASYVKYFPIKLIRTFSYKHFIGTFSGWTSILSSLIMILLCLAWVATFSSTNQQSITLYQRIKMLTHSTNTFFSHSDFLMIGVNLVVFFFFGSPIPVNSAPFGRPLLHLLGGIFTGVMFPISCKTKIKKHNNKY